MEQAVCRGRLPVFWQKTDELPFLEPFNLVAADAIEDFLLDTAYPTDAIGDDPEQKDDEAQDERRAAHGERLVVGRHEAELAADVDIRSPAKEDDSNEQKGCSQVRKTLERLVGRVGPRNGGGLALDEVPIAGEQARLARHQVGLDGHMVDGEFALAGLDEYFDGIRKVAGHKGTQRCLTREGAEARYRVGDVGAGCPAHNTRADVLQELFEGRKVLELLDLPVAHDHVGLARQDGLDEQRDLAAGVLVVGVGIDNDVGAEAQARVDAGLVGICQAAPGGVTDDVIDPGSPGAGHGLVGATVVDEQYFDDVDARDTAWHVADDFGDGFFFVERRDLDNQLHGISPQVRVVIIPVVIE